MVLISTFWGFGVGDRTPTLALPHPEPEPAPAPEPEPHPKPTPNPRQVPDGKINLTPAGGHHFMLEPTPIRLKYDARLDLPAAREQSAPSHGHVGARHVRARHVGGRHVGGRHADADAHQPRVLRRVELLVNAQLSEEETEAPPDSPAAQGGEGGREIAEEIEISRRRSHLEEEMEMFDTGQG